MILAVPMFLIGGLGMLVWGFLPQHGDPVARLLHHQFALAHFRKRRYATTDSSKNNAALAMVTMGEGWHNNHHHYMASARQGSSGGKWTLPITFSAMLSWFRLVCELRRVPEKVLAEGQALDANANA